MVISSLGWLAAIVLTGLFLFVGKPYFYTQGYEQGKKDQFAHDVSQVEKALPESALPAQAMESFGRIVSLTGSTIVLSVESSTPGLYNPLAPKKQQRILVDSQTKIIEKTPLTKEQYLAAMKPVQSGGNVQINPYVEKPILITDLKVSDQIQARPRVAADLSKSEFLADQIILSRNPQNK